MALTTEQLSALYAPFPLEWHTLREGYKLWKAEDADIRWFVYVDWWAVHSRLEDVFPGGWSMPEPKIIALAKSVLAIVGITINGETRWYNGGQDDSGADDGKGALTDGLRRAAAQWGVAKYVYSTVLTIKTKSYQVKSSDGKWKADYKLKEQRELEAFKQFERWYKKEFATLAQSTPTTPQPSQPATPPAVNGERSQAIPDEARNAELRNEELVITRVEPRSDSTGWYGYGLFNDGISNQEVRVNLFAPEDPKAITDAGYQWVTSGKVQWPVVLKIDRNMTRIGTVIAKQAVEPLETPPSAKNGQASVLPSWTGNAVGTCWAVLKQYLLSEHIYDNEYEMKNSFTKRGITVDNKIAPTWKNKPARELIEYCNSRKITDVDFMADGKQPA